MRYRPSECFLSCVWSGAQGNLLLHGPKLKVKVLRTVDTIKGIRGPQALEALELLASVGPTAMLSIKDDLSSTADISQLLDMLGEVDAGSA